MCYCASVDHHTSYIPTQVTSSIVFYVRASARGRVVKKLLKNVAEPSSFGSSALIRGLSLAMEWVFVGRSSVDHSSNSLKNSLTQPDKSHKTD